MKNTFKFLFAVVMLMMCTSVFAQTDTMRKPKNPAVDDTLKRNPKQDSILPNDTNHKRIILDKKYKRDGRNDKKSKSNSPQKIQQNNIGIKKDN